MVVSEAQDTLHVRHWIWDTLTPCIGAAREYPRLEDHNPSLVAHITS